MTDDKSLDDDTSPHPPSDLRFPDLITSNPDLRNALKWFIEAGDLTAQLSRMMSEARLRLPTIDFSQLQLGTSALFEELGRRFSNTDRAQRLLDAGWVPYAGMPIDDLSDDASPTDIRAFMGAFLEQGWNDVRNCLEGTVASSNVDAEAAATFNEALNAFEGGHYRCVVRVLFPEIERVARETIYRGSRKEWSFDRRKEKGSGNTGLGSLRDALMRRLPAGLATHADFGFAITQKMDSHLYRHVGSSPEDLAAMQADPVPNRHASQHGYITYSTRQNAYNALSMTAFMFDVIMRAHRYLEKNASQSESAADTPAD